MYLLTNRLKRLNSNIYRILGTYYTIILYIYSIYTKEIMLYSKKKKDILAWYDTISKINHGK